MLGSVAMSVYFGVLKTGMVCTWVYIRLMVCTHISVQVPSVSVLYAVQTSHGMKRPNGRCLGETRRITDTGKGYACNLCAALGMLTLI